MIIYFTGTGNSKFVADFLADHLQDDCISMNAVMKHNEQLKCRSDKPYIFVAPIYAWRFPQIVEKTMRNASLSGNQKVYCIGTMGSQTGRTDQYVRKIVEEKDMEFMGFTGVAMPNNYVITSVMPTVEEVDAILKNVIPKLQDICKKISSEMQLKKSDRTPLAGLLSGVVNTGFSRYMVSAKNYVVSDKCVSCRKCEQICPLNNVQMQDGKPIFGDACINCYACIHHCPVQAIDIKGKTEKHGRYICPDYKAWAGNVLEK